MFLDLYLHFTHIVVLSRPSMPPNEIFQGDIETTIVHSSVHDSNGKDGKSGKTTPPKNSKTMYQNNRPYKGKHFIVISFNI